MNALEVHALSKRFGGVQAVSDISISVAPGERRLIIGPNAGGPSARAHGAGAHLPDYQSVPAPERA